MTSLRSWPNTRSKFIPTAERNGKGEKKPSPSPPQAHSERSHLQLHQVRPAKPAAVGAAGAGGRSAAAPERIPTAGDLQPTAAAAAAATSATRTTETRAAASGRTATRSRRLQSARQKAPAPAAAAAAAADPGGPTGCRGTAGGGGRSGGGQAAFHLGARPDAQDGRGRTAEEPGRAPGPLPPPQRADNLLLPLQNLHGGGRGHPVLR